MQRVTPSRDARLRTPAPMPIVVPSVAAAAPAWPRMGIDLLRLARPGQWAKNVVVLAALLFGAGSAWRWDASHVTLLLLGRALGAAVAFTVVAAGAYCINDVLDRDRDRLHVRNRRRPLAAGRIPARAGAALGGTLIAGGVVAGYAIEARLSVVLLGYVGLVLAYSLGLKRIAMIDLTMVAAGFVLRFVAGAVAIGTAVSGWLLLSTAAAAVFVASEKRRQGLLLRDVGITTSFVPGLVAHAASSAYTPRVLSALSMAALCVTTLAYGAYTVIAPRGLLWLTALVVPLGMSRYRCVARRHPERNADQLIGRDAPLLAGAAVFTACVLVSLSIG